MANLLYYQVECIDNRPMLYSIVLIEDDPGIQKYLRDLLIDSGYALSIGGTGMEGKELVNKVNPDLVLLDLGLPDIQGEALCSELKKENPALRVIILTAKNGIQNVVYGLELGADDYITKPFAAEELLARIKAQLRKNNSKDDTLRIEDLELNTETMIVKRGETIIELTPQEFRLLHYLMTNTNRVLTREMILNRLWMSSPDIETRVVDVYIGYLRKKIDSNFPKKLIKSVRGFGYTLKS